MFRVSEEKHRAAYEELLNRYMGALRRVAWSYACDGFEDLFQEIAMALWKSLPQFRGESSDGTWVYRVAHNTAITFAANRKRREQREQTGQSPNEQVSPANPEGAAIESQRRETLWAVVQELPLADRQIVVLYLEGLSAAEIEAITGLSAIAVATRLTRIRQKLAAQVRGKDGPK